MYLKNIIICLSLITTLSAKDFIYQAKTYGSGKITAVPFDHPNKSNPICAGYILYGDIVETVEGVKLSYTGFFFIQGKDSEGNRYLTGMLQVHIKNSYGGFSVEPVENVRLTIKKNPVLSYTTPYSRVFIELQEITSK
jgi:hypothetical protein